MSVENTAVTSNTEQLLELIALELAHARLRETASSNSQLTAFQEAIEEKQAILDILPAKLKAERKGVEVIFTYRDVSGYTFSPSEKIANELEQTAWQDPALSVKLSEASTMIEVRRKLTMASVGQPPSARFYTAPEYIVN